jgi:hypothetical protein
LASWEPGLLDNWPPGLLGTIGSPGLLGTIGGLGTWAPGHLGYWEIGLLGSWAPGHLGTLRDLDRHFKTDPIETVGFCFINWLDEEGIRDFKELLIFWSI